MATEQRELKKMQGFSISPRIIRDLDRIVAREKWPSRSWLVERYLERAIEAEGLESE